MKSNTSLIVAAIAVIALAAFAYLGFSRQRTLPASHPTAASCTPEAIRQVVDALERSVLSARCAKQVRPEVDRETKSAN